MFKGSGSYLFQAIDFWGPPAINITGVYTPEVLFGWEFFPIVSRWWGSNYLTLTFLFFLGGVVEKNRPKLRVLYEYLVPLKNNGLMDGDGGETSIFLCNDLESSSWNNHKKL